jgi:hypothetical protein
MKKALMVAVLIGMGWVSASHAVVISWSALVDVEDPGKVLTGLTSARLYYVEAGTWAAGSGFAGTEAVGDLVTGRPVSTSVGMGSVREQATTDSSTERGEDGRYFVVVFDSANKAWRSNASIKWDDATYVTSDPMNQASGLFIGGTTSGKDWGLVPEPNTFALLALGGAALAARRRRKL